jgi:hypothetical protein
VKGSPQAFGGTSHAAPGEAVGVLARGMSDRSHRSAGGRNPMLWIVLLVVLILYALGEIVLTTDLIRLLLVVALIVLIVQLVQGRRVL